MKKVLLVDRDGTIIVEPTNADKSPNGVAFQVDSLEQLEFLPKAVESLKVLQDSGFVLIMVTNQNGIGSEKFPENDFWIPQNAMMEMLKEVGVSFEEVFICPHFREDNCNCRKPKTGMIDDYLATNDIDLDSSYMIGDRDTDLEFAQNIGVKGLKLDENYLWDDVVKTILYK